MSVLVLVDCLNFVFYTVTGSLVTYMVTLSKEKLQPEL